MQNHLRGQTPGAGVPFEEIDSTGVPIPDRWLAQAEGRQQRATQ